MAVWEEGHVGKRIAIVGAGAVGGYVGGYLARAGEDVTLIDAWPEHVEHMRAHGLALEGLTDEECFSTPVEAMHITDAAVFYSRLTKWSDTFDNLPEHVIRKQVWFPLGARTLKLPHGGGQIVVDISETFPVKLEAIQAYRTQFPSGKERVFRMVEGQNRLFGASAGFEAGELFITATTLGVDDLVQTVCPP